jgi:SAM-dependent methyltransferase
MSSTSYVFDHAWDEERERLAGLEWALDPGTAARCERLGVGPGWRCLEVGAGGGSTAVWLAGRVQPGGHVVATDLSTTFLERLAGPGLEIRAHDILADPPPGTDFDLVHTRWMLHWLPDPDAGIAAMTAALHPGGWLYVEEPDAAVLFHASEPAVFRRVGTAWLETLRQMSGVNVELGRSVCARLGAAGLVDVDGEGRIPVLFGASPLAAFLRLGIEKVRLKMVEGGAVTAAEVAEVYEILADPGFSMVFMATVAAWGRKPAVT